MRLPFSVFLRGSRPFYYVAFKNEETGRYLPAISTKKTKETDAVRQAWIWFRDGIPHKGGSLDLKVLSLRDAIRHSTISMPDAEFIIEELKRRGIVLSCVFAVQVKIISDTCTHTKVVIDYYKDGTLVTTQDVPAVGQTTVSEVFMGSESHGSRNMESGSIFGRCQREQERKEVCYGYSEQLWLDSIKELNVFANRFSTMGRQIFYVGCQRKYIIYR